MPRREASVLSAFSFPRKGSGSFLSRGGKELPVCFVEGLLRVPFSTFDEGVRPFLCSLRGSNLSLCSSKGTGYFLSRGGKGADFPEGCVERFRVFFCSKGSEFFLFYREGKISELEGWPFPEPRFFPHPQEKLPNLKGANLFLVPADLLLIDDDSEIEPIHSFSFFMEGSQPFSFFMEMEGSDYLWKGWIPLNLLRGERRKET